MNLSRPLRSLIPSLEGEVLTVLAGAELAFTGKQVQEIIGKYTPPGVRNALKKLSVQGIVTTKPAGAADLYELNREHILAKYIIQIANIRAELFESLKIEVGAWEIPPDCVAVFGSAARNDMTPESDIDIFISRSEITEFGDIAWRRQLTDFSLRVGRWTGNSVNIFEIGKDEIEKELSVKGGVLHSIIEQGSVIYGPPNYLRKLRSNGKSF